MLFTNSEGDTQHDPLKANHDNHFQDFTSQMQHNSVALHLPKIKLKVQLPPPKNYPIKLETWGDHLRKRRMDLKLFQKDVAKMMGLQTATIFNWENNRTVPHSKYYPQLFEFLGYAPDFIFQKINNVKTAGEWIRFHRQMRGWNKKDLATLIGTHPECIEGWEVGIHQPSLYTIHKMEKIFGALPPILIKTVNTRIKKFKRRRKNNSKT